MKSLPFKETSLEKKESKELTQLRDHFKEEMGEFLDYEFLNNKPLKEIFDIYRDYINNKPTFENFKELLLKTASSEEKRKIYREATEKDLRERFRYYLLNKLPHELRKRLEEDFEKQGKEIPIEKLLNIHKDRPHQIVLGFHCTDREIIGNVIKPPREGEEVIEGVAERGLVFYSINHKELFGKRNKYLYFVEGYADETKSVQRPSWIYRKGVLESYFHIPLTNEVIEELGLDFVE